MSDRLNILVLSAYNTNCEFFVNVWLQECCPDDSSVIFWYLIHDKNVISNLYQDKILNEKICLFLNSKKLWSQVVLSQELAWRAQNDFIAKHRPNDPKSPLSAFNGAATYFITRNWVVPVEEFPSQLSVCGGRRVAMYSPGLGPPCHF